MQIRKMIACSVFSFDSYCGFPFLIHDLLAFRQTAKLSVTHQYLSVSLSFWFTFVLFHPRIANNMNCIQCIQSKIDREDSLIPFLIYDKSEKWMKQKNEENYLHLNKLHPSNLKFWTIKIFSCRKKEKSSNKCGILNWIEEKENENEIETEK